MNFSLKLRPSSIPSFPCSFSGPSAGGDVKYRALLILYLVFSALPNLQCIMEKAETFSTRASIMRKHWQTAGGTPDCPGTLIRRQFMKKDGHPLPSWLFKTGIKPQSRQQ